MENFIILISGHSKAGKDTLSDFLVDYINKNTHNYDYVSKKFAFANSVKDNVAKKFNVPVSCLYNTETKEHYRKDMIMEGNDQRDINPFIWCELEYKRIQDFIENNKHFIIFISDNRYYNEIHFFKKKIKLENCKIITLNIVCNEDTWRDRLGYNDYLNHLGLRLDRSERDINQQNCNFDFVVSNNSSKGMLFAIGRCVIDNLIKRN
jgi:phosphomevalonate kinase